MLFSGTSSKRMTKIVYLFSQGIKKKTETVSVLREKFILYRNLFSASS